MIPEPLKILISEILSENFALTIEKGGDKSGDYWIDIAKNQKSVCIHYLSDSKIGLVKNTLAAVYGEGYDIIFSSVSEAVASINELLE